MIETKTVMTMGHFHDFYFLQALDVEIRNQVAGSDAQFSHAVSKLQNDLYEAMLEISENIALRTFVYLYAACVGEARHARHNTAERMYLPETTKKHRGELFGSITRFPPTKRNLTAVVKVFEQPWKSGFGGKAWGDIAKALLNYGKISDIAWIDHVVDLEHNNGTAFSKEDAKAALHFDVEYFDKFSHFLDYKFSKNILKERMYSRWHDIKLDVSRRVYKLIRRYSTIFNCETPDWIRPRLENLTDYNVMWGNDVLTVEEKWYSWVDVSSKNAPDVDSLKDILGFNDFYPASATQKEVKKFLWNARRKVRGVCGKFWTKELEKEWRKDMQTWARWSVLHARLDKCKTTYSVIPFRASSDGKTLTLDIPLPYQGIGEQTENGFRVTIKLPVPMHYLGMTIGGYSDGHLVMDYEQIVLYLNGKTSSLHNKELEALLD